ncbi:MULTISPECIES: hypothetical protein [Gammaproteobacteria]|uniref:Winged helix-turn-helix DNA-binding n=1 Tax=Vreelandella rituensis TaxID=2282306 RepID=A0A368TQ50_9GAMM|nr:MULTISPECIES: hypothetical protein [Gammaproteobacteria]MBQ5557922.1 hypothetical protein [Aeriscardovia sp.]MBQ9003000.1 hypothetical protein [Eggerthellaceae bacterium]MBR2407109.1 hypothetical protein [Clostridia bacterium]MBH0013670.1 hypothetical protein [Pseudoalteromonas sp. NZS100_1]MBH0032997.1 hypothetical protein [Pseudoalteromonas sp. SWYJZ98]
MRNETINKALAHLPATRAELAERLGVKEAQARSIAKNLIDNRYAEEWGQAPTDKGVWTAVLHATGKVPV